MLFKIVIKIPQPSVLIYDYFKDVFKLIWMFLRLQVIRFLHFQLRSCFKSTVKPKDNKRLQ